MAVINGGGFVAVGLDGLVMSSEDGREWGNAENLSEGLSLSFVCFGQGRCLVSGKRGPQAVNAVSKNGDSWDKADGERSYGTGTSGMFFFKDRFFQIGGKGTNAGNNEPYVTHSEDGLEWSPNKDIGGRYRMRYFADNGEIVVGVGDKGRRSWSNDGIKWNDDDSAKAADTMLSLAFGNGRFVGAGLHGMRMSSDNGKSWSAREEGQEGEHINSMLWTGRQFVGVGEGATYFSPDGRTWERRANENPPTAATYGNGLFVGTRWKGRILISTDAVVWQDLERAPSHLERVGFGEFG